MVQGLYSGWRAQRDTAVIAIPAAGDERFELEVEMACNSWAGDDPEPEPGVDRDRLRSSGRGFLEPIADNDTDRGRALNRRVEVKLVN